MQFREKIQLDHNANAKGTSHLSTYQVIHTHHEIYRNSVFNPFSKVNYNSCTRYRHYDTEDIPAIFPVDFSNLIANPNYQ